MTDYGFVRVGAAIPTVSVANPAYNVEQLCKMADEAYQSGIAITVFPELCVTGCTCGDLFLQSTLLRETENAVFHFTRHTASTDNIFIIGMPLEVNGALYNCAAVIQSGHILGIVPKIITAEQPYKFVSGKHLTRESICYAGQQVPIGRYLLFDTSLYRFAVEFGEELGCPTPPSSHLALSGAELIFCLASAVEMVGNQSYRRMLIMQQSGRTHCGYTYCSCGFGESTTDAVYGNSAFIAENSHILCESERFALGQQLIYNDIDIDRLHTERRRNASFAFAQQNLKEEITHIQVQPVSPSGKILVRTFSPTPFIPKDETLESHCNEVLSIQAAGLAKRLHHIHADKVVIGISGGLDSTLALLVCVLTFDKLAIPRQGIIGITMPGFGTTDRTYSNALTLMRELGITLREISIKEACIQHFHDIGHDISVHDTTYENSQARERTQLLMDVANKENAIVIGTGDLSELALGWATYNGDHMSMYGVNAGVPKTLVKHLVQWYAYHHCEGVVRSTLLDIVNTPISPELIPAKEDGSIKQKTEDLVGPYELHDFFIYHFLRSCYIPEKIYYLACQTFAGRFDNATIKHWLQTFLRRFFNQQFKRSCMPDGPMVGSVSLSPRTSWQMPSDAMATAWLNNLNKEE